MLDTAGFVPRILVDFATDHHPDQRWSRHFGNRQRPNKPPVTKNRDAVRNFENLFQIMGNINYRGSTAFEVANDLKEANGFLMRQRRGRLIHDDDARFECQRAGDIHELLDRRGKLANDRIDRCRTPE